MSAAWSGAAWGARPAPSITALMTRARRPRPPSRLPASSTRLALAQPEDVAAKLHGHGGQQLVQALGDGGAGLATAGASSARLQRCRRAA